ncbi:Nitric oxide-associated protein 1 [Camelus dromedarius]|uniref:Nitric oxide-associated protein 1 n=1 Tax=Camelus dromedarius TaxID=9838 RepID=A0A5N4CSS1_CAMDR|nr:Nitric oxide-associated protein 1 [Camelus dromedarius]
MYLELVSVALRRPEPSVVLGMVDLLHLPDALLPHLPAMVGPKQLIVLPQDTPGYLQWLRERLWDDCARAGLLPPPGYRRPQHPSRDRPWDGEENANPSTKFCTVLRDVQLIRARTGSGVEELISVLLALPPRRPLGWRHQRRQVHSLQHAPGVRGLHRQGHRDSLQGHHLPLAWYYLKPPEVSRV